MIPLVMGFFAYDRHTLAFMIYDSISPALVAVAGHSI